MRILFVVVLYKCMAPNSATMASLREFFGVLPDGWSFLFYDNSPSEISERELKGFMGLGSYTYVPATYNGGVLAAYEYALELATRERYEWLVLLDQDTRLGSDFFSALQTSINAASYQVVAAVPTISVGELQVSPRIGRYMKRPLKFGDATEGRYVNFINSGAALKVDFIKGIGGFHKNLWLDGLDHWLSAKIFFEKGVVVLTGAKVAHHLSVASGEVISDFRMSSIYAAERVLYTEVWDGLQRIIYFLALLWRGGRAFLRKRTGWRRELSTVWVQLKCIAGLR